MMANLSRLYLKGKGKKEAVDSQDYRRTKIQCAYYPKLGIQNKYTLDVRTWSLV